MSVARPLPISDREGAAGNKGHRLPTPSTPPLPSRNSCRGGSWGVREPGILRRHPRGAGPGRRGSAVALTQGWRGAAVPSVRVWSGLVAPRGSGPAGVEEDAAGRLWLPWPVGCPAAAAGLVSALPRGSALAAAVAEHRLRPHLCERSAPGLRGSGKRRGQHLWGVHVCRSGEQDRGTPPPLLARGRRCPQRAGVRFSREDLRGIKYLNLSAPRRCVSYR